MDNWLRFAFQRNLWVVYYDLFLLNDKLRILCRLYSWNLRERGGGESVRKALAFRNYLAYKM